MAQDVEGAALDKSEVAKMRKKSRGRGWVRLAVGLTGWGCLFQSATCASDSRELAEQLTLTIVDTFIAGLVTDRLNLTDTTF